MLTIIDLFRERDTIDELGLQAIWDAFAELLFPGTGTVQTRAATSSSCRGSTRAWRHEVSQQPRLGRQFDEMRSDSSAPSRLAVRTRSGS